GKIGLYVPESDRSWASSNRENDHRAITIELMSEASPPYRITEACAKACVGLLVDICIRNGIPKLLWENNRSLIGKIDQQNMTLHRWFTSTDCPGDYIISILPNIVREVNTRLDSQPAEPKSTVHINCESALAAEGTAAALRALGLAAYI
ncbi:MAG: N-acetylmuramoyl-L-alanine amidase, partial [Allobaculum sp.]|nr:N-acetylmuramoyl-L-alanine amidase [Allobaculum sp.]